MELSTKCGLITPIEKDECLVFLGVPFARAKRFEYAEMVTSWDGVIDATKEKTTPMQKRAWPEFEHLENPGRAFYHKEFRINQTFSYDEEKLDLNIYAPKKEGKYPVIVFIHGGGFDSGSIYESEFEASSLASKGVVVVFLSYRVGIFGYFSHKDIQDKCGRDGNFGLDDQLTGIKWVKENISSFYGDPNNITLMGQSAGAMSIQYLCCNHDYEGLWNRAIMMSGAGRFPKFSLPRKGEQTHEYWEAFMKHIGASSLDELKQIPAYDIYKALESFKANRKDNTYNTMPMIDGYLIKKGIDETIKEPLHIDYMIGFTNCDMYTAMLASISLKFSKQNKGYCYYFDIDAPGDDNHAFHSADLRYVFGNLKASWRPYTEEDEKISDMMQRYIVNFAYNGNPNGEGLPEWNVSKGDALKISKDIKMGKPNWLTLIPRTLKGDPK